MVIRAADLSIYLSINCQYKPLLVVVSPHKRTIRTHGTVVENGVKNPHKN